jgi:xanthine dehydrogenase accessory factor
MREVLDELLAWWRSDRPVGMATVVQTWSSAPRQPGAVMLVGPEGTAVGSVSGGCVEGAVYELGSEVIQTGQPQLPKYGVSDDDAFAVGLTCGGTIELFVERIDKESFPQLDEVAASMAAGEPVAVATIIDGRPDQVGRRMVIWLDRVSGSLGSERLDDATTDDVRGMLASGHTGKLRYGLDGERLGDGLTLFVGSFAPKPRMLVFGAIDFAAAVARIGSFLGYQVTVCDARAVFATPKRFPGAEVVVDWPHRYLTGELEKGRVDQRTVICVLTHDAKFDVPVLEVALSHDFAYVGAMGSRRTHDDRVARLREIGVTDKQLEQLASPIGLDLGARTPEETAVSVAAEIIARRWGGGGRPLSTLADRIHHDL